MSEELITTIEQEEPVKKPEPISFSSLWEKSEKVSGMNQISREELFIKLKMCFEDYAKLENIPSKDIQRILKNKKFGELLFALTELSRIDNVNVYAVLQSEVSIAENFSLPK